MKKYILITICAIALMGASCDLFPPKIGGILKTSNGGIDWQASNILKDDKGTIGALSISKLAHDPQATEILYASSFNAGLYKSTDGAATWEQILGQIPTIDFAIHPNDSQIIFTAGYFEGRGRALITRDGGKSWNAVYTAGTNNSSVRAVALNQNNPEQVVIGMSQGELIISNDSGATWRLIQSYNDRINRIYWNTNGMYVLVKGTGLFRSTDGGNSFQLITAGLQSAGNISTLSIFGNSISSYDQVAISSQNPSLMYLTTNLGLYRSNDGGQSWGFVSMPLRQSDSPPTAVAMAPSSDNIIYVSSGTNIYKTSDGGNTWSTSDSQTGSKVNALLVDPNLPQVAYAGVYDE